MYLQFYMFLKLKECLYVEAIVTCRYSVTYSDSQLQLSPRSLIKNLLHCTSEERP